jgi:hypothetical protein
MTIKNCGNHGECEKRRQLRQLGAVLLGIIIVVLLIILIVWLSLRPHKPRFYIQDASVRELNVSSSADLLSAILQVYTCTLSHPIGDQFIQIQQLCFVSIFLSFN